MNMNTAVETINPNHLPVWRPEHDLGRTHPALFAPQDQALRAILDDLWENPPLEVAAYAGCPEVQEEILSSIVLGRLLVRDANAASRRLRRVAEHTPLILAEKLSAQTGNTVTVKAEHQQPIGSFKLRGAFNMIAAMPRQERGRGLIASSAGNHAQGVAYTGRHFHLPTTIVMAETTPPEKVAAVQQLGATVILYGQTFAEANDYCQWLVADGGKEAPLFVPPFDHPLVVAGQATVGKEILEQHPNVQMVVVPCGGGGLVAGIATYLKTRRPDVKIVSVEPETSAAMHRSRRAGRRVVLSETGQTMAEGLDVAQIGDYPFELARRFVDYSLTLSEEEISRGMRMLHNDLGIRAEAAGAVGYAGVLALSERFGWRGQKIVTICSGNNVSRKRYDQLAA